MGNEIARLFASIGADTSDFTRGMNSVDARLNSTGKGFSAFGALAGAGMMVAKTAAIGTAAAIGAVGAAVTLSTNAAADMEQQLANIAAAMGLTAEESAKVEGLITDLGLDPTLKVSAMEAAQAVENLGKNGLALNDILDGAARSTVLLANSTGADFGQAADIASDAMAQFGIAASDMGSAVDQITGVTIASKFTIDDYGLALAQAGGVAASVGVSFEDFNATITAISPLFASGSDAGTSFKTFLQRLIPQSVDAVDAMRDLGLFTGLSKDEFEDAEKKIAKYQEQLAELDPTSKNYAKRADELNNKIGILKNSLVAGNNAFFDAEGNMRSMTDVAGLLQGAFSGLSEEQKNEYATTIFGTDAMRAAFAVAGMTADEFNALKTTIGNTDAEAAAAKRMDTLAGAMEIFSGVLETVQIEIGKKFLPAATKITKWATDLLSKFKGPIVSWFGDLADGMGNLAQAAMIAIPALMEIMTNDGWITGDVEDFSSTLEKLVPLIGRDAANAFQKFMGVVADFTRGYWLDGLKALWGDLGEIAGGWWEQIQPGLSEFASNLLSWATDPATWSAIGQQASGAAMALAGWATNIWTQVQPKLTEYASSLAKWATDPATWSALGAQASGALSAVTGWTTNLWTQVQPKLIAYANSILDWIRSPDTWAAFGRAIVDAWTGFTIWASNIWGQVQPKLVEFGAKLRAWITDPQTWTTMATNIEVAWKGFRAWAENIWGQVQPKLVIFGAEMRKWIDTNVPILGTWIDAFLKLTGDIGAGWQQAWPKISGYVKAAADSITADLDRIGASLGEIGSWFTGGAGEDTQNAWATVFEFFAQTTSRMVSSVVKNLADLLDAISITGEALQALQAGDWATLNELAPQLRELASGVLVDMLNPFGVPGGTEVDQKASGGWASGMTLLGEQGPEVVDLPGGSYVYNAEETAAMLGGGSGGGRIDIYVHGESSLPADRQKLRELAVELRKEFNRGGNLVFA